MKTLIALRGVGNRGKSTTLRMVIQLVKNAYPGATFDERAFRVDATIIITINDVKVGIETQGDPNSRLSKSLKTFVGVGCKVIVCATRTSGQTVDAVSSMAAKGYRITWLDKLHIQDGSKQQAGNRAVAEEIFSAVQAAIGA